MVSLMTFWFFDSFGMDLMGLLSAPLVFSPDGLSPFCAALLKARKALNFSGSLNGSIVLSDFHLNSSQARSNPHPDSRGIKGYWSREENGRFFSVSTPAPEVS